MSNKKKIGIIVALSIALVAVVSVVIVLLLNKEDEYRVLKVEKLEGAVDLERNDEWKDIFKGMNLKSEDMITTGKDSMVVILADSDKHIVAEEKTCFSIVSNGDDNRGSLKIKMKYGTALYTIDKKLNEDSSFDVTTPNATMSVRGTTFEVTYNKDSIETILDVTKGAVEVKTATETRLVEAGHAVKITGEDGKIVDIESSGTDEDATTDKDTTKGEETTTDKESVEKDPLKDVTCWFKSAKWNEDAEGFKTLLSNKISVPIDLEAIDEMVGPYDYFIDGYNKQEGKTMQEILNDKAQCKDEFRIWPSDDEEHFNIQSIIFKNYNKDEQLTAKQIYDEKMWCIYAFPWGMCLDESKLPDNFSWGNYEAAVLDVIADQYGKPSYIYVINVDSFDNKDAKAYLWYQLVYEYDDYVVAIDVQDQPMPQYDAYVLEIHEVIYYTRECWEKELQKNPIGNDVVINDMTYKFLLNK